MQGPPQPHLPHWTRPPLNPSDSDLILTRFSGPNRLEIRSKSGANQVRGEGFGGDRCWRGRSGWEGLCSSSESLYLRTLSWHLS